MEAGRGEERRGGVEAGRGEEEHSLEEKRRQI